MRRPTLCWKTVESYYKNPNSCLSVKIFLIWLCYVLSKKLVMKYSCDIVPQCTSTHCINLINVCRSYLIFFLGLHFCFYIHSIGQSSLKFIAIYIKLLPIYDLYCVYQKRFCYWSGTFLKAIINSTHSIVSLNIYQ